MNDFIFQSPTRFVFGRGATDQVGGELAQAGFQRVMIVYGKGSAVRSGVLDRVKASLDAKGIAHVEAGGVRPNPEVGWVREAVALARAENVDAVLAVGGGSVIDAAKAIAFTTPTSCDPWDFFCGKATIDACLPVACVLTIPAAGSEASSSCVISNDAESRKVGTNSDLFRPRIAVLDPELTFTLPTYQTAAGVTDMMAHICERYFSGVGPVPVTDNIATGLLRALVEAGPCALAQPDDYEARATIMWAGTLAHNDLTGCGRSSNPTVRAGGWESHALEHELSAHYPEITHGAGLAVVMPAWMRYVCASDPDRFRSFGRDVFGIDSAEPLDAIDQLQDFFVSLGMPRTLGDFGLTASDIDPLLVTLRATKGEPFGAFQPLTMEDARAIYLSAL